MQVLGLRKFFLDYLVASVILVLSLYFLFGGITALDTRAAVSLHQTCSATLSAEEVLHNLQGALRAGEHCEVITPCVEWQSVRCEGTLQASGLYKALLGSDLLVFRVKNSLSEPYGVIGYKDTSTFRLEPKWIFFLMVYALILIEAGAVLFALWRQNTLKQTFSLPAGSRKSQLFKPALFAVILGIAVVLMNFLVFTLFDYPQEEHQRIFTALLNSVYGIAIVVILAPLAEELLFRGVLFRFFIEKKRVLLGTVIVSLLFSVVHGFVEKDFGWQLYISSIYFFGSVILCRLYIKQKNLWSPIIFHSFYNSTMVVFYMILV